MVDANVLVAGIGWPRWPYALLQHAVAGHFQLVLTSYIIEEARRNLKRIAPVTLPSLENFLYWSKYEEIVNPPPEMVTAHQQLVRDAKDVPVALAALHAAVDCLVTSDRDLTESEALKKHVMVLLPVVFLREYMGWTSEELEVIRYRTWNDLA
jgi:predicted nucleic acid-binding protein